MIKNTNNEVNINGEPSRKEIYQIAFTSDRDGNWEIYVMNFDGSGQTNISNNSIFFIAFSFAFNNLLILCLF